MGLRVTIELERGGQASPTRRGLSSEAVVQAVRDLAGSRDVTITISPEGIDERVMIAVDGSRAFLGLERPDGLFQFAARNVQQSGTRNHLIGGQETEIENQYLPDLSTTAVVVKEWLEGGESSTQGYWEKK